MIGGRIWAHESLLLFERVERNSTIFTPPLGGLLRSTKKHLRIALLREKLLPKPQSKNRRNKTPPLAQVGATVARLSATQGLKVPARIFLTGEQKLAETKLLNRKNSCVKYQPLPRALSRATKISLPALQGP